MRYVKLRFRGDITGEGYQEINDNNEQVRLVDLNGNTIDVNGYSYETTILDPEATPPWI